DHECTQDNAASTPRRSSFVKRVLKHAAFVTGEIRDIRIQHGIILLVTRAMPRSVERPSLRCCQTEQLRCQVTAPLQPAVSLGSEPVNPRNRGVLSQRLLTSHAQNSAVQKAPSLRGTELRRRVSE